MLAESTTNGRAGLERAPDQGVLLTTGGYYGTLASARCYGRAGIPVYLAEDTALTQTAWSRYVSKRFRAPSVASVGQFGDWLLGFGKRHPGTFLYATSDDLAWVLASRRDELGKYFRMYQPPLATIAGLLDKRRLYQTCMKLGVDIPDTVFPESLDAVHKFAAELPMPTLVKPRTQMLLKGKGKGQIVRSRQDLPREYESFRRAQVYDSEILAYDPSIGWPMLQRYHAEATVDTYSLAGFADQSGQVLAMRASRKLFQRPRNIGVGLCFVSQPVLPEIRERVSAICREVGYYGAFEVEFVRAQGRFLLIDFNPRFYGQLGFEVARDMPLPLLVYHAARSLQGDALWAAVGGKTDGHGQGSGAYHYSNRWMIELIMLTQSLSGRLTGPERRALKATLDNAQSRYVDAVRDGSDTAPLVADMLITLRHFARHPRDFVRQFFLDL